MCVCDQGSYLHPSSLVKHSLHALEFAPDHLLMNGVNLLLKYRSEQIQMFVIRTLDFLLDFYLVFWNLLQELVDLWQARVLIL